MELKWTKNLSVGNAIIDAEHRNLISMTNDVIHKIHTKDVPTLLQEFMLLEGWLCAHFANEKKVAQAIGFPFGQHKLAQQYSLKELQHLKNELEAKGGLWSDGSIMRYADFLKSWIIDHHIVGLDMLMKPALQAYDYDFWPGRIQGETTLPPEKERQMACECGCGCGHHLKQT